MAKPEAKREFIRLWRDGGLAFRCARAAADDAHHWIDRGLAGSEQCELRFHEETLPRGDSCINHVPLCRDALGTSRPVRDEGYR